MLGQCSEAVDEFVLEQDQRLLVLDAVQLTVQRDTLGDILDVLGRETYLQVAVQLRVGHIGRLTAFVLILLFEQVLELLLFQLQHSLLQDALVGLVAQVRNEARLLRA